MRSLKRVRSECSLFLCHLYYIKNMWSGPTGSKGSPSQCSGIWLCMLTSQGDRTLLWGSSLSLTPALVSPQGENLVPTQTRQSWTKGQAILARGLSVVQTVSSCERGQSLWRKTSFDHTLPHTLHFSKSIYKYPFYSSRSCHYTS